MFYAKIYKEENATKEDTFLSLLHIFILNFSSIIIKSNNYAFLTLKFNL